MQSIVCAIVDSQCLEYLGYITLLQSTEADLDLTSYKGRHANNRRTTGFGFSIKMVVYLHKRYREEQIVNSSTSSYEVSCNPCVLSELCCLLNVPVLTKQGGVDK